MSSLNSRCFPAACYIEERTFWHVVLSVSWTLTIVLALAALGRYAFARLLWINAGLVFGLLVGLRGRLLYRGTAAPLRWTVVLPIVLLALAGWRFFPVSEYVIGGKDPGVYINEGIQIAQRGTLTIHDTTIEQVPAFARDLFFPSGHKAEYYSAGFMGFFIQDPAAGRVVGQFPHLFPASIAVTYGANGLTGAQGINIVRMQCALEKRGGDALLIIGSDTEFPSTVLDQIRSSSNILSVKVANLS